MATQHASNGAPNGHNGHANGHGFHSDSEFDSASTVSSEASNSVDSVTHSTASLNLRRRMKRKKSSPMMPAFMVSAPGKVIVFGEHAVVHGKVSAHGEETEQEAIEADMTRSS
jgi:mevalonate kinase